MLITTNILARGSNEGVPLDNAHKVPSERSVCELELRLGIIGKSFNPDIGTEAFTALSTWARTHCTTGLTSESVVEILKPSDVEDMRKIPLPISGEQQSVCGTSGAILHKEENAMPAILRKVQTNGAVVLETKHKVYTVDISQVCGMPGSFVGHQTIDARIAVNVETPFTQTLRRYDVVKKRCRSRTRYAFGGQTIDDARWWIDMTQVTGDEYVQECEFEISEKTIEHAFRNAHNSGNHWASVLVLAKDIASFIDNVLMVTAYGYSRYYFGDMCTVPVSDGEALLRKFAVGNLFSQQHVLFPGSMPCNLHRQNLLAICESRQGAYCVAEKTDGVRNIMIIDGKGTTYLVDRSLSVKKMQLSLIQSVQRSRISDPCTAYSILDGELVRDFKTMDPIFLAFDILVLDGTNICGLPYSQRQTKLASLISAFDEKYEHHKLKCQVPRIILKDMHHLSNLRNMFPQISNVMHGDRVAARAYATAKYTCKIDGLIFTPDKPYLQGADEGLLKWKYPDCWTLDVAVMEIDEYVTLGAMVYGTTQRMNVLSYVAKVKFHPADHASLVHDFPVDGTHKLAYPYPIIECGLDPTNGMWVYIGRRHDKDTANYIGTFIDTLTVQAENISDHEIIHELGREHGSLNWATLHERVCSAAIGYSASK